MREWVSLVASAGHLALALLLLSKRSRRKGVGTPLALLCLNLFVWNFATSAYAALREPLWQRLDLSTSPLAVPLTLHVTAAFVGRSRSLRPLLGLVYLHGAATGLVSAYGYQSPAERAIAPRIWSLVVLAGWIPAATISCWLLFRHLFRASDSRERARTRLVLSALLIGGSLASTELLNEFATRLPGLGHVGTLVSTTLLTMAALKLGLVGHGLTTSLRVYVVAIVITAAVASVALFGMLRADYALLLVGSFVVTLAVVLATREAVTSTLEHRDRVKQWAALGRVADQMTHDLRNPLAALKGAVQFLQEERTRGGSSSREDEFLSLIVKQVERVDEVLSSYDRLARIEPVRRRNSLLVLARDVMSLQHFAAGPDVLIRLDTQSIDVSVDIDREMVAAALENVIQNAIEALPGRGEIVVRTELVEDESHMTAIAVRDTGPGMDARTLEHVFDDFYTTKAEGSGLGLAFVRRVTAAHEGDVRIESRLGQGTTVRLLFPHASEEPR